MAEGDAMVVAVAAAAAASAAIESSNAQGFLSQAADEEHQIRQFNRIVQFRDAVVAGAHPRVRVPAHLVSSKAPSLSSSAQSVANNARPGASSTPTAPGLQRFPNSKQTMKNRAAFQANASAPAATESLPGLGSTSVTDGPKTLRAGRAEINPVLLVKSDDLIRAEIQLQRTRAERALRDQLEQRRTANRALQASETLPDFDLDDVLQKALVLVHTTTAATADPNIAANKSDASACFDDNALYSSDLGTPEPAHGTRVPNDSEEEDVEMRDSSDYEPQLDLSEIPSPVERAPSVPHGQPQAAVQHRYQHEPSAPARLSPPSLAGPSTRVPSHEHIMSRAAAREALAPRNGRVLEVISSAESGEASASGESANADNEQSADDTGATQPQLRPQITTPDQVEPRLIRGHNLSPFAPQPAHVSPLVTSRQLPAAMQEAPPTRGTPAQVAALRKHGSTATSPESSPRGARIPEKKKGKKNRKRKADRQATDTAASPYIKPEPRSPSPMNTLAFVRPHKRQKQGQQQQQQQQRSTQQQPSYEEPRYTQPAEESRRESRQYDARPFGETGTPVVYERRVESLSRPVAAPFVVRDPPRQRHDFYDEGRRPLAAEYLRRPESPGPYPAQYPPRDIRSARAASAAVIDLGPVYRGATRDVPREGYYASRDMQPAADHTRSRSPVMYARTPVIPVSRVPQPARVVVDESGREYIEPPRPAPIVARHSLAPQARRGESEVVYERVGPPPQAATRMPDTFEENGVIYRRASPGYVAPRRVVTQPEYQQQEYRAYRQPEYSVRPLGPQDEGYAPYRQVVERRMMEEPPREQRGAAAGTRPPEPIRYADAGHGYAEEHGSARPEASVLRYAASSYPEARGEQPPPAAYPEVRREFTERPVVREYSVRPEAQVAQRAYSVRPVERPYYTMPSRADEEVAFVERRRGGDQQEIQYVDALPREVYR